MTTADSLLWSLLAGTGLTMGLICTGLCIWCATRLTVSMATVVGSAAGFGIALFSVARLYG